MNSTSKRVIIVSVIVIVVSVVAIVATLAYVFLGSRPSESSGNSPQANVSQTASPQAESVTVGNITSVPYIGSSQTIVLPAMSATGDDGTGTLPSIAMDCPEGWTITKNTFSAGSSEAFPELTLTNEKGLCFTFGASLGFPAGSATGSGTKVELLSQTQLDDVVFVAFSYYKPGWQVCFTNMRNYEYAKSQNGGVGTMAIYGNGASKISVTISRVGGAQSATLEEAGVTGEELGDIIFMVSSLRPA